MAINTESKRRSIAEVYSVPDGVIGEADRRSLAWLYADTLDTEACALSGSITSATEALIAAGGLVARYTLSGATWVSGAAFDAVRQAIIDGHVSGGIEATGWNALLSTFPVTDIVRIDDEIMDFTLSALPTYDTVAPETITTIIPDAATDADGALIVTPTFTIFGESIAAIIAKETQEQKGSSNLLGWM